MARDVTLSIGGDLSPLIKDIDRLTKKKYSLDFRTKGNLARPLGKISGQLGEFEKSLEASNARVLAFSASAGALYAFQRGIEAVFNSAVDLEKQLADINVILNISSKNLNKFGNELFGVAKNTAQSFKAVAGAATELARQGLSVEETLKRTSDALILTRLSGMDAVSAVEALTAALNSFSRAAMDSTVFVSKLAAVDAAFAVSSADLAEAVKRVGSSAQEAGLDINELIAAVTSAQQITARGGAVIGNSFKTIFTRIQRPRVLKQLEELGIRTTDLAGKVRPAMRVLEDLAKTFDTLSDAQKSQITQSVGGVFQVNVLKASLRDLGKEFSLYKNALDISNKATDEATRRNEELNKTVAATLNKTVANLQKTAAEMGGLAFSPVVKKLTGALNKAMESIDIGEGIGGKMAQGILGGLGKFFEGGGLALAGVTLFRVFQRLVVQVQDAFKTLTGMGKISENELLLQRQINDVLGSNPAIIQKIKNGELAVSQVHKTLLHQIELENKALHLQKRIADQIASSLNKVGVTIGNTFGEMVPPGGKPSRADDPLMASSRKGHIPKKSKGHIPNYSKKEKAAKRQELREASYAKPSTRAVVDRMPGLGKYVRNTAEKKISGKVTGHKQDWINPPKSSPEGKAHRKKAIKQTGIDPYGLRKGMIPNFAKIIDWDKLGQKQYTMMMNHALGGGHRGRIINVAGPGGSGKNYFAENLVSKMRVKGEPDSSVKGRAKGVYHRGKEGVGKILGKIPLVGKYAEKQLRGHHAHKAKGGSYAMTPEDVATNEAMIFLHATAGSIGKRKNLFLSPRTQRNYLIARSKEQVQELRNKRTATGAGAMGRKNSANVGSRDYTPLQEKLNEIGATISYVKSQGFVPNFAKGDVIATGGFRGVPGPNAKPTITTGAGASGRQSYKFGTYKTKVDQGKGKKVDFMTMTADAVKDPLAGGFAIQGASVYTTPANHPLRGQGFGTKSYIKIKDKAKSAGFKGIYSANQLSPDSGRVWQSLLANHGASNSGLSAPYGRYVFRRGGNVPNFALPEPLDHIAGYIPGPSPLDSLKVADLIRMGAPRPNWHPKSKLGRGPMNDYQSLFNRLADGSGWRYEPTGKIYSENAAKEHAKSLGIMVKGFIPNFYSDEAAKAMGHDPDHGRQMILRIFKDKKSFKGGRGNEVARYRGTSMQLHSKVDSTSKNYLKQHKGKAWQIVDGPTLAHSSPNPPPGTVSRGSIPNFAAQGIGSAVTIGKKKYPAQKLIPNSNLKAADPVLSANEPNILTSIVRHARHPNPNFNPKLSPGAANPLVALWPNPKKLNNIRIIQEELQPGGLAWQANGDPTNITAFAKTVSQKHGFGSRRYYDRLAGSQHSAGTSMEWFQNLAMFDKETSLFYSDFLDWYKRQELKWAVIQRG